MEKKSHNRRCYATTLREKKLLYHHCGFAVGTAVISTVFLIVPIFKNTSFMRMGETLEAWIFFAIIIIANCKKPLESALKTFVFFL